MFVTKYKNKYESSVENFAINTLPEVMLISISVFPFFNPLFSFFGMLSPFIAVVLYLGKGLVGKNPRVSNGREAEDSHNDTKDHQKHSPNGVKGSEVSSVYLEVENARENKHQAGGGCGSHYSKHMTDIRHKDGQQQHHTQDD